MPDVIDVDAPIFVDLTLDPPMIDLTRDIVIDLSKEEPAQGGRVMPPPTNRGRLHHSTGAAAFPQFNYLGPPSSISLELPPRTIQKRPGPPYPRDQLPKKPRLIEQRPLSREPQPASPKRTPSNSPWNARAPKREYIELDTEGDETTFDHFSKNIRREQSSSSEDDEEWDYANIHAGFDLTNPENWKPMKFNEARLESDLADAMQDLSVSSTPLKKHKARCSGQGRWKLTVSHPDFVWEALQNARNIPADLKPHRPKTCNSPYAQPTNHNHLTRRRNDPFTPLVTFKSAPGPINKIIQSGPWVSICTATLGGYPDQPDEEPHPWNGDGMLMAWNDRLHKLLGHQRIRNGTVKNYSINDIKVDPCSHSLVSSGNDKTVHIWTLDPEPSGQESDQENDGPYSLDLKWNYMSVPHDLAFKPGESILAVAERKIFVYSGITDEAVGTPLTLSPNRRHAAGALVWGHEPTSNHLFASSEPRNGYYDGHHRVFDIGPQELAYELLAEGAGDAISITSDGTTLALLTREEDRKHSLRIYDVHRRNPRPVRQTRLRPFPADVEGEVNCAVFSPDGIYLALARNDNHVHVYDSRKLDRMLFDYEHSGPSRVTPGNMSFGVLHAQWTEVERGVGLVTGGNDGCVRLWNPLIAADNPTNGRVLAETSSDVAFFSIGDHFAGERDLIVGDCAGEVSVYDRKRS